VTGWLSQQWEPEELRHGAALKRDVETAWPEFDWNATYRDFFAEYSCCCGIDRFAATQELELASRCVVETGAATLYRALSNVTDEPVLKRTASLIAADEVRYYKHFYRFFQRYQAVSSTHGLDLSLAGQSPANRLIQDCFPTICDTCGDLLVVCSEPQRCCGVARASTKAGCGSPPPSSTKPHIC
jgi:hypothetical protein